MWGLPPRPAAPHLGTPESHERGCRAPTWACLSSTPNPACCPPTEDSPLAPGNKLVFSSYPGTVFSCDDFYVLGSGLVSPPLLSPFSLAAPHPATLAGTWLQPPPPPLGQGVFSWDATWTTGWGLFKKKKFTVDEPIILVSGVQHSDQIFIYLTK